MYATRVADSLRQRIRHFDKLGCVLRFDEMLRAEVAVAEMEAELDVLGTAAQSVAMRSRTSGMEAWLVGKSSCG